MRFLHLSVAALLAFMPPVAAQNFGNIPTGTVLGNVKPAPAPAVPTHPAVQFNPRDFKAVCDGVADDYPALRDALAAAAASPAGAKTVYIDCALKIVSGSLTIDAGSVTIQGSNSRQAKILCRNGTGDCIKTAGTTQLYGLRINDLTIDGLTQTGGNCLNLFFISDVIVSSVIMDNCWNGFLVGAANNVTVGNHTIIGARNPSGYALKWYTDPASGKRSDVINLVDGTINNNWSGADGVVWDGASYTMRATNWNVIAAKKGLVVLNTAGCTGAATAACAAGSGSGFPQFGEFVSFEVDGASSIACHFAAGFDVMMTSSICSNHSGTAGGNADTVALQIDPDTSGGITRAIKISNSHIGNSKRQAALINGCQNCYFSNTVFDDASKAGAGSYPAVEVGANGANVNFIGGKMGPTFGNGVRTSHGLRVDGGSAGIYAIGVDYNSNITGAVDDQSGAATVIGGTGYDGKPLGTYIGGLGGLAPAPGNSFNYLLNGAPVETRLRNAGATANSASQYTADLSTIANAYMKMGISTDGSGGVTGTLDCGSGVNVACIITSGAGVLKLLGLTTTPTGKQPLCIDNVSGQIFKGSAGAC